MKATITAFLILTGYALASEMDVRDHLLIHPQIKNIPRPPPLPMPPHPAEERQVLSACNPAMAVEAGHE